MNHTAGFTGAAVALSLLLNACGGGGHRAQPVTQSSRATTAVLTGWAAHTDQLCREKKAAIANLGYVHITYAGIARVGLPRVRRSLEGYLGLLLSVLREFHQQQQQLTPPPRFASTMKVGAAIDAQSQAATRSLRNAVGRAHTARDLSSAFRLWVSTLQRLTGQEQPLIQRLGLPGCQATSGVAAPTSGPPAP